jgi:hypothetical protein
LQLGLQVCIRIATTPLIAPMAHTAGKGLDRALNPGWVRLQAHDPLRADAGTAERERAC